MKNETREKKPTLDWLKKIQLQFRDVIFGEKRNLILDWFIITVIKHVFAGLATYIGIGDDIVRYRGKCKSTHTVPNQEQGKYSSERQEG
jgi:hypothetical protein